MPFGPLTRSREVKRDTCLRHFAGRLSIKSGVFDATTLVADGNGRFVVPIGTFLSRSVPGDPTKVKAYQGLGTDVNDVQTVTITGTPTGGTFTLTFNGQTTAPIAFNANAAAVQAALTALSNIGAGNAAVSGGALPGAAVVVTFQGALAAGPQNVMTASGAGLTGGTTPAVSVAHTTTGTTSEKIIGVFDGPDKDFFGNTVASNEPVPIYYHECVFDVSKLQNWTTYGAAAKTALYTCQFY